LIRHPERIEITGFRLSPEWRKWTEDDFLRFHQISNYKFICYLLLVICNFIIGAEAW